MIIVEPNSEVITHKNLRIKFMRMNEPIKMVELFETLEVNNQYQIQKVCTEIHKMHQF